MFKYYFYTLFNSIHRLIVLLIIPTRHVVHPLLVIQIPAHRLLDTLLKLKARLPAQLLLKLRRVDGVAHVVAQTVRHVGYQVHILTFLAAQQTVHRVDHHLDDVNVLPLVEATDIIGFRNLPVVEDDVNSPRVVFHVQPVANVLALAIHRQRLAVADVVDEQWYQLLRKLVRAVVVRAVRYDGRHAVRVVVRTHKVVARCFRG